MRTFFIATVILFSLQSLAQEIDCPEGTSKGAPEYAENTLTLFCQRLVATEKGLLTKSKKELVIHGPFKVFEKTHSSLTTYRLLKAGQMSDGKPVGKVTEYYPDESIMSELDVVSGSFKKFHPNGTVRTVGQLEGDNFVGTWKFFDPTGKLLAEGPYGEVKKVIDRFDKDQEERRISDAKKVKEVGAIAQKEHLDKVRKSWEKKKRGAVAAYYDKRARRYWSDIQGMSNWFVAKQKCTGLGKGWYLPTAEEITEGDSSGLSMVVESYGGDYRHFWTATDQSLETDPQRSLLLQNQKQAMVHLVDQGDSPAHKLRDSHFVICTSK